jgi:hypothetical protein
MVETPPDDAGAERKYAGKCRQCDDNRERKRLEAPRLQSS